MGDKSDKEKNKGLKQKAAKEAKKKANQKRPESASSPAALSKKK